MAQRSQQRGILLKLRERASLWRMLRCRRGAMAMEFAFAAPVFFAMLFAVIEFGRMFFISATLQFVVEQAGREAMAEYTRTYWTDTDVADATLMAAIEGNVAGNASDYTWGFNVDDLNIATSKTVGGSPDYLVITGSYTFSFLVPLIPVPDITLRARTRVPMAKST